MVDGTTPIGYRQVGGTRPSLSEHIKVAIRAPVGSATGGG